MQVLKGFGFLLSVGLGHYLRRLFNWRLKPLKSETENLIQRLSLIKDHDPFNKRVLNDCHTALIELSQIIETLEKQLYELAGTEQKL
jgi:hypothetical protein